MAGKSLELLPENERKKIVSEAHGYIYYYTTTKYQFSGEDEVDLQQTKHRQNQTIPEPAPPAKIAVTAQSLESMAKPCGVIIFLNG